MNADHEAWFVMASPLPSAGKTLRVRMMHDLNRDTSSVASAGSRRDAARPRRRSKIKKNRRQSGLAAALAPAGRRT